LKCSSLRELWCINTKTWIWRKVAVTATKKSRATMGLSVIAQERGPTLIAPGLSWNRLRHVLANCSRRNTNSELQQPLVGDPFLTPGRVLRSHASNHTPKIGRNGRTAWSGFEPPDQPPTGPMPANHSLRAHHSQAASPLTQPAPYGQAKSRCSIDPMRLPAPFFERRDLPAQDQVLRGDGLARLEKKGREPTDVSQQPQKESHQQDHKIMMPLAFLLRRELRASNICGAQSPPRQAPSYRAAADAPEPEDFLVQYLVEVSQPTPREFRLQ